MRRSNFLRDPISSASIKEKGAGNSARLERPLSTESPLELNSRKSDMKTLTLEQTKRFERLAQRPASEIDLSDMPETTNWEGAVRGQRPTYNRAPITLYLDPDVLEWFKSQPEVEGADINQILRQFMRDHQKVQ